MVCKLQSSAIALKPLADMLEKPLVPHWIRADMGVSPDILNAGKLLLTCYGLSGSSMYCTCSVTKCFFYSKDNQCTPIVLISASSTSAAYVGYIQGAGDDEESWAKVHPTLLATCSVIMTHMFSLLTPAFLGVDSRFVLAASFRAHVIKWI